MFLRHPALPVGPGSVELVKTEPVCRWPQLGGFGVPGAMGAAGKPSAVGGLVEDGVGGGNFILIFSIK